MSLVGGCEMKNNCPQTLKEVSQLVQSGEGFQNTLGNFLDEFQRSPIAQSFRDAPVDLGKEINAFLAAVAEQLATEIGVTMPSWANNPGLVFEPPLFPTKNPAFQASLLDECPAPFKRRGIIVSKNALSRA